MLFLFLIARFYEKFSGQKTYFRFFIVPIVLFGTAAVRSGAGNTNIEVAAADLFAAGGGISLLLLTINLALKMLNKQRHKEYPG